MVVAPYGRRLGLRVNQAHSLSLVRRLCADLGWEALDGDEVDVLISIRFAPPASKGTRHYHLLYYGGRLVERTLSQIELLESLSRELDQWARQHPVGATFIPGVACRVRGKVLGFAVHPAVDTTEFLQELRCSRAELFETSSFAIDTAGELRLPAGATGFDGLFLVSSASKDARFRRIPPGPSAMELFQRATSRVLDPETALAATAKAGSTTPVFLFSVAIGKPWLTGEFWESVTEC